MRRRPTGGSRDEPFSHLGGTLNISGGFASTPDLRFESKDLLLAAGGAMRLDGSAINLQGQVQLSDELSQQAGRDLLRYTQDQGRVTLPATITGSASNPQVRIDVASMAKRAITNRATGRGSESHQEGPRRTFSASSAVCSSACARVHVTHVPTQETSLPFRILYAPTRRPCVGNTAGENSRRPALSRRQPRRVRGALLATVSGMFKRSRRGEHGGGAGIGRHAGR